VHTLLCPSPTFSSRSDPDMMKEMSRHKSQLIFSENFEHDPCVNLES
jgi:hypothetical protein